MAESDLIRAIRHYLQIAENQGQIDWFERLNSGGVIALKGGKPYKVQLCRTGTPDFIVIQNSVPYFIEAKIEAAKLSLEQVEFANKMVELCISCFRAETIDEVIRIVETHTD